MAEDIEPQEAYRFIQSRPTQGSSRRMEYPNRTEVQRKQAPSTSPDTFPPMDNGSRVARNSDETPWWSTSPLPELPGRAKRLSSCTSRYTVVTNFDLPLHALRFRRFIVSQFPLKNCESHLITRTGSPPAPFLMLGCAYIQPDG